MSDTFKTDDDTIEPRRDEPRAERRDDRYDNGDAPRARRDERRNITLADFGRMNARPTVGGIADAALSTLVDAFDQAKGFDKPGVPDEIKRDKFKAIPLDSYTANSALSSLLIVLPTTIGAKRYALAYILMCEQPGEPSTRVMSERGESYDALILPENHLTEKYQRVVTENIGGVAPDAEVVMVGSQVILAETIAHLTEKEGSNQIARIFDNALDAISGMRENLVDRAQGHRSETLRINPSMVEGRDRLEVTFDYSGRFTTDSSGLPIRSDVTTSLYYSQSNRDEDEDLYSRTAMGEVRAGLDLIIDDAAMEEDRPRFGRGRRGRRDERDEPFWQAVLNVTSIASAPNFPYSLELAQLLLAQIALQSNDYRWAHMLKPRSSLAGDLKPIVNLGHLNLMNPDPDAASIIDDIGPNSSDDDIADYLDMTVAPKVTIGMAVPTSGEKSWVLSIYEQIATTKDGRLRDELINTLYDSADVLTGGRFREVLKGLPDGDLPPVRSAGTRVLLGTWDDHGKIRPLSEWNVPAVLTSVGAKNREMVYDFQYTLTDTRYSPEFNLAQRAAILKRIVPGFHPTNTAEQLILNPAYIHALTLALDDSRMSAHISGDVAMTARRRLGNDVYSSMATSDIGVSRRRRDDVLERGRSGGAGLFGRYY